MPVSMQDTDGDADAQTITKFPRAGTTEASLQASLASCTLTSVSRKLYHHRITDIHHVTPYSNTLI